MGTQVRQSKAVLRDNRVALNISILTSYPLAVICFQTLHTTPQRRRLSPIVPIRRPVLVHREPDSAQAGIGGGAEDLHDMSMLGVEKDPDGVVGRVELEQDPTCVRDRRSELPKKNRVEHTMKKVDRDSLDCLLDLVQPSLGIA
jgi:hypothetical protein